MHLSNQLTGYFNGNGLISSANDCLACLDTNICITHYCIIHTSHETFTHIHDLYKSRIYTIRHLQTVTASRSMHRAQREQIRHPPRTFVMILTCPGVRWWWQYESCPAQCCVASQGYISHFLLGKGNFQATQDRPSIICCPIIPLMYSRQHPIPQKLF